MIANVLKTIGLCLTSLSSFNAPTKTNANPVTTNIDYMDNEVASEQYEGKHLPTTPYPITNTYSAHYLYNSSRTRIDATQINSEYVLTNGSPFNYASIREGTLFTFGMMLIKITHQTNTINTDIYTQLKVAVDVSAIAYSRTQKMIIKQYTWADNLDETTTSYFTTSYPLYTIEQETGDDFNTGTKLYNRLILQNINKAEVKTIERGKNLIGTSTYTNIPITSALNAPTYIAIIVYADQDISTGTEQTYQIYTFLDNENIIQNTQTEITGNITYEVVDVPDIAFTILGMPFSFISHAFNLTLFPGTPYAINISNIFLSIIGILVFIFIIRKFLGR